MQRYDQARNKFAKSSGYDMARTLESGPISRSVKYGNRAAGKPGSHRSGPGFAVVDTAHNGRLNIWSMDGRWKFRETDLLMPCMNCLAHSRGE